MDTVTLMRESYDKDATWGKLIYNDETICLTAELPWLNNEPNKSCIPEGSYQCEPHNSLEHPLTIEIMNVPGRAGILIHGGNVPELDSRGCVLVGDSYGYVDNQLAVMHSQATMAKIRLLLPPVFTLQVCFDTTI